ncbi:hypothetical protein [Yersinia phage MHG19]|nr:hypothetical protein [Yersinia phage MHG19]
MYLIYSMVDYDYDGYTISNLAFAPTESEARAMVEELEANEFAEGEYAPTYHFEKLSTNLEDSDELPESNVMYVTTRFSKVFPVVLLNDIVSKVRISVSTNGTEKLDNLDFNRWYRLDDKARRSAAMLYILSDRCNSAFIKGIKAKYGQDELVRLIRMHESLHGEIRAN